MHCCLCALSPCAGALPPQVKPISSYFLYYLHIMVFASLLYSDFFEVCEHLIHSACILVSASTPHVCRQELVCCSAAACRGALRHGGSSGAALPDSGPGNLGALTTL